MILSSVHLNLDASDVDFDCVLSTSFPILPFNNEDIDTFPSSIDSSTETSSLVTLEKLDASFFSSFEISRTRTRPFY